MKWSGSGHNAVIYTYIFTMYRKGVDHVVFLY
jgi:hypothetical protein